MPVTWLDIAVLVVIFVSAILAMMRGFTREVLSNLSWALAAIGTYFTFFLLRETARSYVDPSQYYLADIGLAIISFMVILITVSVLTLRLSDLILDSRVGALDRSLGFVFGAARGLLLVVLAYLIIAWLYPPFKEEGWAKNARTVPILVKTGEAIAGFLPEDTAQTLLGHLREKEEEQPKPDDNQLVPQKTPEESRKNTGQEQNLGYGNKDRQNLDRLIENTNKNNN